MLFNLYKSGYRIYKLEDVFSTLPSDKTLEIMARRLGIELILDEKNKLILIK